MIRAIVAAFALIALALMVSSFAPITLSDFARFTMRVAGFVSLALAYIAFEARNIVEAR